MFHSLSGGGAEFWQELLFCQWMQQTKVFESGLIWEYFTIRAAFKQRNNKEVITKKILSGKVRGQKHLNVFLMTLNAPQKSYLYNMCV